MDFNDAQERAVMHGQGPALVLASPGSGKTAVITHRINNLITKKNVSPENILITTFSKAAAQEMRERFEKLCDECRNSEKPFFGTFHSLFFMIIKYAYHYNAGNIISEKLKMEIIRTEIERLCLETEDINELCGDLLSEISRAKGNFVNIENFISSVVAPKVFRNIYYKYQKALHEKKLIDYDDMLLICYELLSKRPDILSFWQKRFQYILIDEFQDINRIQYETMKLLGNTGNNIFVVGDDDQSIYGFRGSSPGIMNLFTKDFPEAEKIILNINYRSRKEIINAAQMVIQKNTDRLSKNIIPANDSERKPGMGFFLKHYASSTDEYEQICKEIQTYRENGGQLSEIAFLFRNNKDSSLLIQTLGENNIPFQTRAKTKNLSDHFVFQDFLTYMKLGKNLYENSSDGKVWLKELLLIINKPSRYISRNVLNPSVLQDFFDDRLIRPSDILEYLKNYYKNNETVFGNIKKLESDLTMIGKLSPYAAIQYIKKAVGYEYFLKETAKKKRIDYSEYEPLLEQIEESSRKALSMDSWIQKIHGIDELLQNQSENTDVNENAVQVMTMHASKGLEFNIVYLTDVNENIIPSKKAVSSSELQEERRLFYVAMTRAKISLRISYAEKLRNKKAAPSVFLSCFF